MSNGGTEIDSDYVRYGDTYGKSNLYNPPSVASNSYFNLNNNIYTLNYNNYVNENIYFFFEQPFDNTYSPSTTYTVVVEVLSFSGDSFALSITSPFDSGSSNLDVATSRCQIEITNTGFFTTQFNTLENIGSPIDNLRSYVTIRWQGKVSASFRISIFTGNIYYNNFTYATVGNTPSSNNLPSPTRTGYTFAGWYKETSFQNLVTSSTVVSTIGDHTLYAKWNANQYTVSYSSEGNVLPDTKTVTYDSQYGELLSLTREGYTFDGWYLDSTFVTPITATTTVQTPRDHTLYAKWTAKNPAQYDEEIGKWYVEMGKYPQTRLEDEEIKAELDTIRESGVVTEFSYNIGEYTLNSYIYNEQEYAYFEKNDTYYLVEPVRYYLANDNGSLIEETTFTGSNYLNLGREYMYTEKITVSLWAYMDNWSDYEQLQMKMISCTENGGWDIASDTYPNVFAIAAYEENYGYRYAVSSVQWSSLVQGWHMFTMTFDGTYLNAFIDGTLVATSEAFESHMISYNPNNVIFVGAEAGPNQETPAGMFFEGKIKGVHILNEALDESEIKALMNGGYYSGYGTESSNVIAVSEKVIFATIWNDEYVGLNGGYTSSNSTIWNNFDNHFMIENNIGWDGTAMNSEFLTQKEMIWEVFTNANGDTTAQNSSMAYAMPTATADMDEVFGEGNYEAEFSDLVADILGNALMYWTRDVGSELNNAECITRYGSVIQATMQNLLGVRVTINVKTFACV